MSAACRATRAGKPMGQVVLHPPGPLAAYTRMWIWPGAVSVRPTRSRDSREGVHRPWRRTTVDHACRMPPSGHRAGHEGGPGW